MFWKKKERETDISHGEIPKRQLSGKLKTFSAVLAIGLSFFQLYTAAFGIFNTSIIHRAVHLTLILSLFFLLYPARRKAGSNKKWLVIDLIIAAIAFISIGYIVLFYDSIAGRIGNFESLTGFELTIGTLIIVLVLEATRRTNFVFFFLMLFSLVYMIFGPYFPGLFSHPGIKLERLIYLISFSTEGIFGTGLAVSSTYLFLFILFGVFLGKTGVTDFFINFALSLVGRFSGGSAKACVIGSSLMGTVSGSSIGNAVAVGAFTIPMMKSSGFRSHVAAAIESIASTGGQIMPPVMGAAAFIMAEVTGIPYGKIALAALIPALIYYINIFAVIHFESKGQGLEGIPKNELPRLKHVIRNSGYLVIPLVVLIYMLMIAGSTATKAGFAAIIAAILVTYLRKENRFGWKDFLQACEKGAYSALEIAVLCAGIGIIISAVVLTGLGMRFSSIAMALSGGNLVLVLIMSMIVSLVLGMGMPTPVVYLLMAMFSAPTMVDMGVPVLAAHLFVFYFAILSGLTPPVCIVAIVSAGIAQANWLKTGLTATRFALPAFIIPYMWVFGPPLLMIGTWYEVITAFIFSCIGAVLVAGAVQGWFLTKAAFVERIILFAAGLLMIKPGWITDLTGLFMLFLIISYQWRFKRRKLIAMERQ